jgi:hypothetical protein
MQIKWVVLCERATQRDGLLDVRGLGADTVPVPNKFSVVALVAFPEDPGDNFYPVAVTLRDSAMKQVMEWGFMVKPKLPSPETRVLERRELWDFPLEITAGRPGVHTIRVAIEDASADISFVIKV